MTHVAVDITNITSVDKSFPFLILFKNKVQLSIINGNEGILRNLKQKLKCTERK